MIFVWIAGIELDLQEAWTQRGETRVTAGLALGMPLLFGGAAAGVLLVVASVSGKLAGVHLAGRVPRWKPGEASLIGWLLQTMPLIMIIFVNILLDKGVITSETFTALLLVAVASTMLTIPVATPKLRRWLGAEESSPRSDDQPGALRTLDGRVANASARSTNHRFLTPGAAKGLQTAEKLSSRSRTFASITEAREAPCARPVSPAYAGG